MNNSSCLSPDSAFLALSGLQVTDSSCILSDSVEQMQVLCPNILAQSPHPCILLASFLLPQHVNVDNNKQPKLYLSLCNLVRQYDGKLLLATGPAANSDFA